MRILIVDDEVIIRTGLASVIKWQELGLELLTPAASAEEALARIADESPHILLTDIRMRGKTGLELAEEAVSLLPDLEVIILSGYDDFAYTQQAIRQNVGDYLLKTSKPEEIINTVLKAKQRITERWNAKSHQVTMRKEEKAFLLQRWIIEGDTSIATEQLGALLAPLAEAAGTTTECSCWQVIVIEPTGWEHETDMNSLLAFAVENMLQELTPCISFISKQRIVAVLAAQTAQSMAACITMLHDKMETWLKCSLFIAAGSPVDRVEQLHRSYILAEEAYGYRALWHNSIVCYEEIRDRSGGLQICTYEQESQLSAILLQGDTVALHKWIKQLFSEQLSDPQVTPQSMLALIQSILIAACRWLIRVTAAAGMPQQTENAPMISELGVDTRDILYYHLNAIMRTYHEMLGEGREVQIQKALAYIEENLERDVGLQQLAQHVHLHPNHLSEVFKRETGMTFVEYVTRQKMTRATELLTLSPAKVSEIAMRVGYGDVKYFTRLFKKHLGMTPSEYRGQISQK